MYLQLLASKSRSYERRRTGHFIACSWKDTWKSGSVFLLKIKKRIVSLGEIRRSILQDKKSIRVS